MRLSQPAIPVLQAVFVTVLIKLGLPESLPVLTFAGQRYSSSIINSLLIPRIAILAYVSLGEALYAKEMIGLVLVGLGVLVVQLKKN